MKLSRRIRRWRPVDGYGRGRLLTRLKAGCGQDEQCRGPDENRSEPDACTRVYSHTQPPMPGTVSWHGAVDSGAWCE